MAFKANFLLWIVVEFLWFALQLSFIQVIYLHTDNIGGWTKWEVVCVMGTAHFIQQIFQAFFLVNCTELSELVRTGKLDFFLLLPASTRFLVSFRKVDLGGFVNAISALVILGYALNKLHFVPNIAQVFGFMLLCMAGIFIHYSLMFSLASVSFWTVRAQGIVYGYYSLFNIARMPDVAFHGAFKIIFKFVLPILLVANVPVKLLLGKLDAVPEMFLVFLMAGIVFFLSHFVWTYSLRRYTSASS
jgi:ABC-2 type transport system permease protein